MEKISIGVNVSVKKLIFTDWAKTFRNNFAVREKIRKELSILDFHFSSSCWSQTAEQFKREILVLHSIVSILL